MPINALKGMCKKAGVPLSVGERYWEECKASVEADTPRRWQRVMGCTQNRLNRYGRKK